MVCDHKTTGSNPVAAIYLDSKLLCLFQIHNAKFVIMPKLLSIPDYHRVVTYKKDLFMTNTAIAERLGIRRQTVAAILLRDTRTGSPVAKIKGIKKRTKSAPTLRTDQDIQRLRLATEASPFKTPRVLKKELKLRCSLATIKRRLREMHLGGRRAATKTFLTDHAKENRVTFANEHINLDWRRVMFTDEVKIETSAHGMTWVRRPPGTRYDGKYIREVNRQGRCSVMIWGAMTYNGLLDLVVINGSLNQNNYVNDILIPKVLPYKEGNQDMIFMQDGAAPHRANTVKKWLKENNIEVLKWPAQSPDLNPLENYWNMLKEEIGPLNDIGPNQTEELVEKINQAWDRLRAKRRLLMKLYNSMKKRIQMVINKNGSHTNY